VLISNNVIIKPVVAESMQDPQNNKAIGFFACERFTLNTCILSRVVYSACYTIVARVIIVKKDKGF